MASWEIETLEGIMATAEGGIYNVISRESVEALLADNEALKLLAEHGYQVTPYINDAGEVVGHVIRTAASSNGTTSAVSNTVQVLVKDATVDQTMLDGIASGSIGTASDVGELAVGDTISQVTLDAGGAGVGGTALATVAGPAIAVGLGVAAGTVMYNIAPEFWTEVSEKLVAAGKTIGGKVISFFDKDGNTYYDDETIDIIEKELIKKGYLSTTESGTASIKDTTGLSEETIKHQPYEYAGNLSWKGIYNSGNREKSEWVIGSTSSNLVTFAVCNDSSWLPVVGSKTKETVTTSKESEWGIYSDTSELLEITINNKPIYYQLGNAASKEDYEVLPAPMVNSGTSDFLDQFEILYIILYGTRTVTSPAVKPKPSEGVREIPSGNPTDKEDDKKKVYPFPFPSSLPNPDNNDNPASDPSDNYDPDPTANDDDRLNPKDDPNDKPKDEPEDVPSPNPNPNQPESDPTDDKPKDPDDPNPKNPDDGKMPDLPFPIVPSAGLGNIYNPTRGQVEALQSYLWSSTNLVDIMKIFQNPVDGIISLHWVFGTPIQGGSKEITLGYLPTGVSAPTVANQFIDVDCGTISIPLKQKNALDYPPYTDIQIYLPFIGIQPLNAYDLVGGTLNIKYRIDAYTGACVAKLTATRGGLSAKLYEFAGNCGYELPLTSGNFIGMVGNVVSGAVMGALTGGVAGAALGATSSIIHSNLNVSRSGNLSANAGICGSRNPYIIITRAVPYDAANYNQFYGYPSNKTVYLSNCKGFTKVKEIILHTSATQAEKEEIEALLKEGIYL